MLVIFVEENVKKNIKIIDNLECDLLPVQCVVNEYFSYTYIKIEELRKEQIACEGESNELENHVEGYFNPNNFSDSKVNKINVKRRLKDVVGEEKNVF